MPYRRRDAVHVLLGALTEPFTKHDVLSVETIMAKQKEAFETIKEGGKGNRCRLDLAVRYLAADSFSGGGPRGAGLYKKMQSERVGKDYGDISSGQFQALIKSCSADGYDSKSEIELGSDLMPIDGTHRLALALYLGIKTLPCKIRPFRIKILYDVPWFEKHGFSKDEILLILSTMEEIIRKST